MGGMGVGLMVGQAWLRHGCQANGPIDKSAHDQLEVKGGK